MNYTKSVEKWGVFEFYSEGTTAGNPFLERGITALFESDSERKPSMVFTMGTEYTK